MIHQQMPEMIFSLQLEQFLINFFLLEEVAEAEAVRLETEFDAERIKALIANGGWAAAQA